MTWRLPALGFHGGGGAGRGLLLSVPGVVLLALLTGCDQGPLLHRYNAEKDFFEAERNRRELVLGPEITDQGVQDLRGLYLEILEEYPMSELEGDRNEAYFLADIRSRCAVAVHELNPGDAEGRRLLWEERESAEANPRGGARTYTALVERVAPATGDVDSLAMLYSEMAERLPPGVTNDRGTAVALEAPLRRALLYRAVGREEDARAALGEARRHYDRVAQEAQGSLLAILAHEQAANAAVAMGDLKEGERILEETRGLPNAEARGADILFSLAEIAAGMGDLDKSLTRLEELGRSYPDHRLAGRSLVRMGEIHLRGERYDAALATFERAEETLRSPDDRAQARLAQALALRRAGREREAILAYRSVFNEYARTPAGIQAPVELAQYHRELGDEAEARQDLRFAAEGYEKMLEGLQGQPVVLAMAMDNLARVYRVLENWSRAADVLEARAEAFPQAQVAPLALRDAAVIRKTYLSGQEEEMTKAIRALETLVERYSKHPAALDARSMLDDLRSRSGS